MLGAWTLAGEAHDRDSTPGTGRTQARRGAALFGLRLVMRELGYLPDVQLLPDPADTDLLAQLRCGADAPITPAEQQMLTAMPCRHTHRGPFTSDPLPSGLLAGLQHDALAEGGGSPQPDLTTTTGTTSPPERYSMLGGLQPAVQELGDVPV
jgi:hypothetical protein